MVNTTTIHVALIHAKTYVKMIGWAIATLIFGFVASFLANLIIMSFLTAALMAYLHFIR